MTTATAIFFHPDQIEGKGRDLVGRRSAGQSFLKGYLRHTPGDTVRAVTDTAEGCKAFEAIARALGEKRPLHVSALRGGADFTSAGTIFFPTPGYSNAPWLRQRFGPERCSLVGITHTISTRRIIEGLHHLMSEPVEPWDAIICTSRAVRSAVQRQFAVEADYLRQRFGATRVPQPHLPVIPLGIDTEDFTPRPGTGAAMRAAQATPEDAVVIMTMGRLSVVEKANPLPLFLALEEVAQTCGKALHLWLVGWASRPEEEALHREGAAAFCPSVTLHIIDGRDPTVRRDIWAGADIFTLPADSIQETFGLVPVEAMAAGLPVVMPDWDGFRDTVLHGQTGFLIPTRMARPGMGQRIARRFADETDGYLPYLTLVQAHIQIDVPAYAQALGALVADADLRARMGQAGMQHVRANLDWQAVIPQYLALAKELAQMRQGAQPSTPRLPSGPPHPLEIDPFDQYADYPSGVLTPDTPIILRTMPTADMLVLRDRISGRALYRRAVVSHDHSLRAAALVGAAGSLTLRELATQLDMPLILTEALVLVLAKSDILGLPTLSLR